MSLPIHDKLCNNCKNIFEVCSGVYVNTGSGTSYWLCNSCYSRAVKTTQKGVQNQMPQKCNKCGVPTILSLEQLNKLMQTTEDSEDNEIDCSLVYIDQRVFNAMRDQFKVVIGRVNNAHTFNIYFGSMFRNPWGDIEMAKMIITPVKANACHDVTFRFNKGEYDTVIKPIVNLLKGTIPVSDRSYDPATRTWSFIDKYMPAVKKLAETIGMQVEEKAAVSADGFFYEHAVSAPAVESKDSLAHKLAVLLSVDISVLNDPIATKKAYRAKALLFHPDRNNGDGTRMSELNSVWGMYNAS